MKKIALFILCFALFVAARVLYESRREFFLARTEAAAGRTEEAIVHWDRSVHWYAPGNPYVKQSIEKLWETAQKAEEKDPKTALLAYDAIRGSIHAVRSFYWPYREWLPRVNERIAVLRAREQAASGKGISYEAALTFHQKALQINERPNTGWTLVVQLAFLGWLLSVVGLIWKGFDPEGRMHWKPSFPWIAGIVLFFTCWVVGLLRA